MSQQCRGLPLLPPGVLSAQQKQIYEMYTRGLSNREIAAILNINPKCVAAQLSRIRKKAANLDITYKIEPGAEHAQKPEQISPAAALKKKIQDDPGFFKLMRYKYGTDEDLTGENKYRLATAGHDSALLKNARARQIKAMAVSGRHAGNGRIAVKIERATHKALIDYLHKQNIKPLQSNWDDDSAVYLVTPHHYQSMQQLLRINRLSD